MWYVLITKLMEWYTIDMYSFSQSYLNKVVKNVTTENERLLNFSNSFFGS